MRHLRFLFLCLAGVLLLISCSGNPANDEIFSADFSMDDGVSADFNGLPISFAVILDSGNGVSVNENVLGFNEQTLFCEYAEKRLSEVQKQYNCNINVFTDNNAESLKLNIVSGTEFCDVWVGSSMDSQAWSKAGYKIGIPSTLSEEIDYTDSAKWGRPEQLQPALWKDDLFGVIPAAWPEQVYSTIGYLLIANMDQVIRNGAQDPRELIEKQEWNWAAFEQELIDNTVNQGTESAKYGMVTADAYFSQMLCFANGAFTAVVNDDGSYGIGWYTQNGRTALDEIKKIWRNELSYTIDPADTHLSEIVAQHFTIDQHGAFSFLPTQFVFGVFGLVCEYLDNFAVLTTPVGPDVSPDFVQAMYHAQNYMISFPVTASDPEAAATCINAIYAPFTGYETYEKIKEFMGTNYFFDSRDTDNFFRLYDSSKWNFDYCIYPQGGFFGRNVPNDACISSKSVTEILDGYKDKFDEYLDMCVTPVFDAQKAVFGYVG